jgi:hypothetical protein
MVRLGMYSRVLHGPSCHYHLRFSSIITYVHIHALLYTSSCSKIHVSNALLPNALSRAGLIACLRTLIELFVAAIVLIASMFTIVD